MTGAPQDDRRVSSGQPVKSSARAFPGRSRAVPQYRGAPPVRRLLHGVAAYRATVSPRGRRILLVSSSGGVLLDLLGLRPWWSRHDVSWVAVPAPDTREVLGGERVSWTEELTPR